LSTYYSDTYTSTLYLSDLANWLKVVPGSVVVLLESCGSGAGVYANANGGTTSVGGFSASAAIQAFAAVDTKITEEQTLVYYFDEYGEPLEAEGEMFVTNTGEFRVANKFYVLTASDYQQLSYGVKEDFATTSGSYNYLPYAIKLGVGTSGTMPADTNTNKQLTLNELYVYVYNYCIKKQTTRVYPSNSSFVLFTR